LAVDRSAQYLILIHNNFPHSPNSFLYWMPDENIRIS
jgi:hypothetical protein